MVNYLTGRRRAAQKSVCPELHNAELKKKKQLSGRGGLLESEPIGGQLGGRRRLMLLTRQEDDIIKRNEKM